MLLLWDLCGAQGLFFYWEGIWRTCSVGFSICLHPLFLKVPILLLDVL